MKDNLKDIIEFGYFINRVFQQVVMLVIKDNMKYRYNLL